jgi:hypothetical protein
MKEITVTELMKIWSNLSDAELKMYKRLAKESKVTLKDKK